jgi:hypothetical protein
MESSAHIKLNLRVLAAMFAAFTLVFSATAGSATTAAFAVNEAELKALPKESLVDDGSSQLLRLKFTLDPGSTFELVRITIDKGTPDEAVLEFGVNASGFADLPPPPLTLPFEFVFGKITLLTTDSYYYAIGKAKGDFVIAMNKLDLGEGTHQALAEVELGGGETLSATDEFTLKSLEPNLPDLVAYAFVSPTTILKNVPGGPNPDPDDLKYWTFTLELNVGDEVAKNHHVKVFLSTDETLDLGDKKLGVNNVNKLEAGDFDLVGIQIKAPPNKDPGDYFLIVKVDVNEDLTDKIEESDETNNELSEPTKIIEI